MARVGLRLRVEGKRILTIYGSSGFGSFVGGMGFNVVKFPSMIDGSSIPTIICFFGIALLTNGYGT